MAAIKLELEIQEVNTILKVLSRHPFDEVVGLINKIQTQGNPQAAAIEEAEAQQQSVPAP